MTATFLITPYIVACRSLDSPLAICSATTSSGSILLRSFELICHGRRSLLLSSVMGVCHDIIIAFFSVTGVVSPRVAKVYNLC